MRVVTKTATGWRHECDADDTHGFQDGNGVPVSVVTRRCIGVTTRKIRRMTLMRTGSTMLDDEREQGRA